MAFLRNMMFFLKNIVLIMLLSIQTVQSKEVENTENNAVPANVSELTEMVCVMKDSGTDLSHALECLQHVDSSEEMQLRARNAWLVVKDKACGELTEVLSSVRGEYPLGDNWIRTALEASLEQHVKKGGSFPVFQLEHFLRNRNNPARGRFLAWEILNTLPDWGGTDLPVGKSVFTEGNSHRTRLLNEMLEDPCYELRFLAVAQRVERIRQYLALHSDENKDRENREKVFLSLQHLLKNVNNLSQTAEIVTLMREIRKDDAFPSVIQAQGYLMNWHTVGLFSNQNETGFHKVFPPEESALKNKGVVVLSAVYAGLDGDISWQKFEPGEGMLKTGEVDLTLLYGVKRSVITYAYTTFMSEISQRVSLRYASFNGVKIWVNGRLISEKTIYYAGMQPDQTCVNVDLRSGENYILVKISQNDFPASWATNNHFYMRLCDEDGKPLCTREVRKKLFGSE